MLHYEKRKNNKFFENIQLNKKIEMSRIQNFIPSYTALFGESIVNKLKFINNILIY